MDTESSVDTERWKTLCSLLAAAAEVARVAGATTASFDLSEASAVLTVNFEELRQSLASNRYGPHRATSEKPRSA